jgi:hypothetical protein
VLQVPTAIRVNAGLPAKEDRPDLPDPKGREENAGLPAPEVQPDLLA